MTSTRRKGAALFAVMVVVAIGAAGATSLAYRAQVTLRSSRQSIQRTEVRAAAWSGLQAVMAELADQRDELLGGAPPTLTESWTLGTDSGGRRLVYRLVRIGGAESGAFDVGVAATPEASRLNVNTATPEALARVPGLANAADAIVAARQQSLLQSVGELARIEGVDADLFFAPDVGGARLLTCMSADPSVQAGVGSGERGNMRINLDVEWSDELGSAVERRFGTGARDAVKQLMEQGTTFESTSDLVRTMASFQMEAESWIEPLDVFSTTDAPVSLGLVDLLTADQAVLELIPGFDAPIAEAIVATRDGLSGELRVTPVWPLLEGIVEEQQMTEAIDFVCCRSMQWRVRIEAGYERGGDDLGLGRAGPEAGPDDAGMFDELADDEDALEGRMVIEAVVDVSERRPRVAYLRDVTLEELARSVGAEVETPDMAPERDPGRSDPMDDMLNAMDDEPMRAPSDERAAEFRERRREGARTSRDNRPERDRPERRDRDDVDAEAAPATDDEGGTGRPATGSRVGRWTTGGGS